MSEKKDDVSQDELDQIIQDMSHEEEDAPKAEVAKPVAEVVQIKKPTPVKTETSTALGSASPEQKLSLEMSGVIHLKLSFTSGERSIEVICSEEALVCRMADGAEFRIPTGIAKARKAS